MKKRLLCPRALPVDLENFDTPFMDVDRVDNDSTM